MTSLPECVAHFSGSLHALKETMRMRHIEHQLEARGSEPFRYLYWFLHNRDVGLAALTHVNDWLSDKTLQAYLEYLQEEHLDIKVRARLDREAFESKLSSGWLPGELLTTPQLALEPVMRAQFWLESGLEPEHWRSCFLYRRIRDQMRGLPGYRDYAPLPYEHYKEEV